MDSRCPKCDRAECQRERADREYRRAQMMVVRPGETVDGLSVEQWALNAAVEQAACDDHRVDWRARALEAERTIAADRVIMDTLNASRDSLATRLLAAEAREARTMAAMRSSAAYHNEAADILWRALGITSGEVDLVEHARQVEARLAAAAPPADILADAVEVLRLAEGAGKERASCRIDGPAFSAFSRGCRTLAPRIAAWVRGRAK